MVFAQRAGLGQGNPLGAVPDQEAVAVARDFEPEFDEPVHGFVSGEADQPLEPMDFVLREPRFAAAADREQGDAQRDADDQDDDQQFDQRETAQPVHPAHGFVSRPSCRCRH